MEKSNNRYKDMERIITFALIGAAILFIIFLIASGTGNIWLKILCALVAAAISGGCLWILYQSQELLKERSLWMSVSAAAIIICIIASLLLNYPSPNLYK